MEDLKISSSIETVFSSGFGVEKLTVKEIREELANTKLYIFRGNPLNKEKFNVLLNVLLRFDDVDPTVKSTSWNVVKKACSNCSSILGRVLSTDDEIIPRSSTQNSSENEKYLAMLKMSMYLVIHMSLRFHSDQKSQASLAVGKSKKKVTIAANPGFDIETELRAMMQFQLSITDLDISKLWSDRSTEDDFINQMSDVCYTMLEDPAVVKNKNLRSIVIELLGSLIKKYGMSVSAALKVTQLLQNFDHLAVPLAEALHVWTEQFKCRVVASEVLRELSNIPEKDLIRDTTNSKSISVFISEVAKLLPECIRANMNRIMGRLEEESYTLRNTVMDCIKEVLLNCLRKEDLDKDAKEERDQLMEVLFEHANLDVNAFVRARAVNAITVLVKSSALPITQSPAVLVLGKKLLYDRSNLVRKGTIQLLSEVIRWNPYAAKLPSKALNDGLQNEVERLKQLGLQIEAKEKKAAEDEAAKTSEEQATCTDGDEAGEVEAEKEATLIEEETKVQNDDDEGKKPIDLAHGQDILTYLTMALAFVRSFHETSSVMCELLRSKFQSDVLEAIEFYKVAFIFQLDFAMEGVQVMLDQIWSEDTKIRDAVVDAYRELYFTRPNSTRTMFPIDIVNNMISLISKLSDSNWDSFEHLLVELKKSGVIPNTVIQIMWNYLEKSSDDKDDADRTTTIIQLLGMLATDKPEILHGKTSLLVKVGLKCLKVEKGDEIRYNFKRATYTCVAFTKLAPSKIAAGIIKKQIRYENDSLIIQSILDLVIKGFPQMSTNYITFALEAIGVLFLLSKYPLKLSSEIFYSIKDVVATNGNNELLTRYFSICGHLALKTLIFVETDVLSEICKQSRNENHEKANKNTKKKEKKKSGGSKRKAQESETEEESDEVENSQEQGIATDEAQHEFINDVLENEVVAADTMLGSISRILVKTCSSKVDPNDVSSVRVQQSAALALSKYMMVSAKYCDDHLRLFFTMLEQSPHEGIRANLLVAASDLCVRFPNQLEPWNSKIYNRLNDESNLVRVYALKVLTNLVLSDMIKVKGHVSEIARCIVDENEKLKLIAKRFFADLSKKGNSLYNVIPDIISRLSDTESNIPAADYRQIMKFLFDFISKDKQAESLIEKLCHRFKATRDREQWRNLAFCLTLLPCTEKGFRKLMESFNFYADILGDEQIFESFKAVIAKAKKTVKNEVKTLVEEFEQKLNEKHETGASDDECANKAAAATQQLTDNNPANMVTPRAKLGKRKIKGETSSDEEEEVVEDKSTAQQDTTRKTRNQNTTTRTRGKKKVEFSSSEEDEDPTGEENSKENEDDEEEEIDDGRSGEDSTEDCLNDTTPIRRKPTPKTRRCRTLLRA